MLTRSPVPARPGKGLYTKRGTPRNPKLADLQARLNISLPEAVGILELMWHFTAEFAPQGNIGKHSDKAIAKAVGWQRPTGARGVTPECKLSEALVASKWLEPHSIHRLIVHDWPDHADQSVTRKLARQKLDFIQPETSQRLAVPLPEPMPYRGEPLPDSQSTSAAPRSEARGGRQHAARCNITSCL